MNVTKMLLTFVTKLTGRVSDIGGPWLSMKKHKDGPYQVYFQRFFFH